MSTYPDFISPPHNRASNSSQHPAASHVQPRYEYDYNLAYTGAVNESSSRVNNNRQHNLSNNPFTSQSCDEMYPQAKFSGSNLEIVPVTLGMETPEGIPYEYYSENTFSPPSEVGSYDGDEYDDDDYGDVSPYWVGDRPDPVQLPFQCNTYFDPTVDLEQSMKQLEAQLANPFKLDDEFQSAPQLRTDFTVYNSVLPDNQYKNRYQDILPYDRSRVILKYNNNSCNDFDSSGDYINANHLFMILPDGSKINYIAAQGPLEETITDFWRMIWEQNCFVVVMLTNVLENTLQKCHPYWPEHTNSVLKCGHLLVSCNSPPIEETCVTTREISLMDSRNQDIPAREIHLLHYTKWPDKKCPENSDDFLSFVKRVRHYRSNFLVNYPLLVHCSAGIGRTGVFIVVETACRLIELNMPVLPLDLVRVLRDQRPYMIQTPEQFSFVCRAILAFYRQTLKNHRSSQRGLASQPNSKSSLTDQNYQRLNQFASQQGAGAASRFQHCNSPVGAQKFSPRVASAAQRNEENGRQQQSRIATELDSSSPQISNSRQIMSSCLFD